MASSGVGSPGHVFGELFKMMTGVNTVHVPYRGSPGAFADLIAGQVQVIFETTPIVDWTRSRGHDTCVGSDDRGWFAGLAGPAKRR